MSQIIRKVNPACQLTEHGMCSGTQTYTDHPCECNCHATVDTSFFDKGYKKMIVDIAFISWTKNRNGGVEYADIASLLVSLSGQPGWSELEDDKFLGGLALVLYGVAINRDGWSSYEVEQRIAPFVEKLSQTA